MKKIIFTTVLVFLWAISVFANGNSSKQKPESKHQTKESKTQQEKQQKYEQLRTQREELVAPIKAKYGEENCRIKWDEDKLHPRTLTITLKKSRAKAEQQYKQIIEDCAESLQNITGVNLDDLRKTREAVYNPKFREATVMYEQEINGIRVENTLFEINLKVFDEKARLSIGNHLYPNIEINTTPTLSAEDAVNIVRTIRNETFSEKNLHSNELIILYHEDTFYLVYKVIYVNMRTIEDVTYYIDANTGVLVKEHNNIVEDDIKYPSKGKRSSRTTYVGTVKGDTYHINNPLNLINNTPLENVVIKLHSTGTPGGWQSSGDWDTDSNGSFNINFPDPIDFARTDLLTDINNDVDGPINVRFSIINHVTQVPYTIQVPYTAGQPMNFIFNDTNSHEPNVCYNLNRIYDYLNQYQTADLEMGTLTAYTNADIPLGSNWGKFSPSGYAVFYKAEIGKASCTLQHEFVHCYTIRRFNSWTIAQNYSATTGAMDEAFATYFPCANNLSPEYIYPDGDIYYLDQLDDDTEITSNEAAHTQRNCRWAIAAAWWELRAAIGEDETNQLLWAALDEVRRDIFDEPDRRHHPREFFNRLLEIDDMLDDDNPLTLPPHFDEINTAYKTHGMFYYPEVIVTDMFGNPKTEFENGEDVYVKVTNCPRNEPIRLYTVQNPTAPSTWKDGDILFDISTIPGTGIINADGDLGIYCIWQGAAQVGDYDVVVDVNTNGQLDIDFDDIIDGTAGILDNPNNDPAFTVLPSGIHIKGANIGVSGGSHREGEILLYSAHWHPETDTTRTLIVDTDTTATVGDELDIELTFSNPMDTLCIPTVNVGYGTNKSMPVIASPNHSPYGWVSDTLWIGEVTLPEDYAGDFIINVQAKDVTNNWIDADPSTIPHMSDTTFVGIDRWFGNKETSNMR